MPLVVFVPSAFAAFTAFLATVSPYIIAASIAYSIIRQQQLSRRMRAAQDAAKGTTIPIEAEVKAISVAYGRVLVGGNRVYHNTANNYIHANNTGIYFKEFVSGITRIEIPEHTETVPITYSDGLQIVQATDSNGVPQFQEIVIPKVLTTNGTALDENRSGNRHEYLFVQQTISLGEIEDVVDVIIDPNRFYNNPDFRKGQRINIFKKGNAADEMIAANYPERRNAIFTNIAYASMCLRLDRDAPQYQGVPQIQFLVKGRKLKDIQYSSNTYSLSAAESYSNNPARVLLDYLMSSLYGLALTVDQIDLESFYKAKLICDTVVETNRPAFGHMWIPSSSNLYLQPAPEKDIYHPFLKENAVWEYKTQATVDFESERVLEIDKTFQIYLKNGSYTVYLSADDSFILNVNNVLVGQSSTSTFTQLFTYTINIITSGLQTIRLQAGNPNKFGCIALKIDDTSPEKNNVFDLKNPQYGALRATLPLFECNVVIDPETNIRDNLETILETMNSAELIWSNGKYKLLLSYPTNEAGIFAGLTTEEVAQRLITDDIILNDSFSMRWPNASERLNHCTIKFANEGLDFKDDAVSWPNKTPFNVNDTVYATMLAEDNGVRLESDFYERGIVDIDHALAKAEERVRKSRNAVMYEFKVPFKSIIYEPGDILRLRSVLFNVGVLQNEYIQVQDVNVDEQLEITIKAVRFSLNTLAWNVADNVYAPNTNPASTSIFQKPYDITITDQIISWKDAVNTKAINYKLYYWSGGSAYIPGGVATGNNIKYFTGNLTENPIYYIKLTEITKVFYGDIGSTIAYALFKRGSNISLLSVITGYLADSTVNADFINNTNTQYITNLYRRVIGREPDVDGLNWWVTNIGTTTRAQLFLSFVDSTYEQGLYFKEFGATNLKEAFVPPIEAILGFSVRGFDTNNNGTAFSDLIRLFESDGTSLLKTTSILPAVGSSDTFITIAGATAPTPTTNTFNAVTTNFLSPAYAWYLNDIVQVTTTSSIIVPSFAASASKNLKVIATDDDGTTATAVTTITSLQDGALYNVVVESTNGDTFRIGQATITTLIAHVFLNDDDVTATIPASRFKWRRISQTPRPYPDDDATWNALFASGYKQIEVNINSVYAFATFHCDILSE